MSAGNVMNPALMLTADEQELLDLFRTAPLAVKAAAINALHGTPWAPKPRAKEPPRTTTAKAGADQAFHGTLQGGGGQTFHGTVRGGVAGRDIVSEGATETTTHQTNHAGITIGAVHGDLSVIQIERLKTCAFLRDLEALVQRQQEGVAA